MSTADAKEQLHRSGARTTVLVVLAAISLGSGVWTLYQLGGAPSVVYYPLAVLVFVALPVAAGIVARRWCSPRRPARDVGVALCAWLSLSVLFVGAYAFVPYLLLVDTVTPPTECDGSYITDARRQHVDGHEAVLIVEDDAVRVDTVLGRQPGPTRTYVVDKATDAVVYSIDYPDDNVAVAIRGHVIYLFNDALGTWIDKRTGESMQDRRLISVDSYGRNVPDSFENTGVFGWRGTFETTGYFSIWWDDGEVELLRKLTFSGLQRGCHVDGATGQLTKL